MAAGTLNITIEQGATFRQTLTWKTGATTAAALPVDITGYTARMQLRASPVATTILLSLTDTASADGQLILGGTAGTVEIYIKDTATNLLSGGGSYDLELVAPNTDVYRLVQGSYSVSPNVTR